jgi:hypothetical protein
VTARFFIDSDLLRKEVSMRLLQMALAAILITCFVTDSARAAEHCYYSPVDSVLYVQYWWYGINDLRIRDGGQTLEETIGEAPGIICTSEPIPGKIYCMTYLCAFDTESLFVSDDWGDSWSQIPTLFRGYNYYWRGGRPGDQPGESFLMDAGWVYFTRDSWQTRDSIFAIQDSPSVTGECLFFDNGLMYGSSYPRNIHFSSDTGRTWSDGHPGEFGFTVRDVGAPDELWGLQRYVVFMLRDSGRTIDTVFQFSNWPQPDGTMDVIATGQPGEAYLVIDSTYWPTSDVDLFIYHIQDYGAQVDSFYYFLGPNAVESPPIARGFQVKAYPNPFNAATQIEFMLPSTQRVSLRLYDVLGREVAVLVNEIKTAGEHRVTFDASGLASGVYLCRMQAGSFAQTRKIVLVR